jgi:hypothetical protein
MHEGGYARLKRELLCIEGDAGAGSRRAREVTTHRIPLCYTDDLHRFDLYNRRHGVQMGLGAYERLRGGTTGGPRC